MMNALVNDYYYCRLSTTRRPQFDDHNGGVATCSLRRHHRRRRNNNNLPQTSSSSDSKNLQMVIDIEYLSNTTAPLNLQTQLNKIMKSGNEAFLDLQSLITIDSNKNIRISCRKSTLDFVGNLAIWGFVIVIGFRVLVKLGALFRNRFGFGSGVPAVITRRDRSLGGKEVVVGNNNNNNINNNNNNNNNNNRGGGSNNKGGLDKNRFKGMPKKKLPLWWPVVSNSPLDNNNKEYHQIQANRLITAIMDYRMSGKDIWMDDIVQLRQICRVSGVKVSIDTANSRDSLYRASVDFVLNICSSVPEPSAFVQIIGEDAREFLAGLADNIALEKDRAARMVTAAVAARTRSWLLQAWALEMQGKHSEAVTELSKLSLTHRIFPPEESSPEMEMVARGLEKHLRVEQREYLMNMFIQVCGEETCRSVAEALGLQPQKMSPGSVSDQQHNEYTPLN